MARRVWITLLICWALASVGLEGQFLRGLRRKPATADTPPVVVITSPTSLPTFLTTADNINLSGTCKDDLGCRSITWSNDRGGSGTAVGASEWDISSSPTTLVVAQDTFDPTGANVNITSRTSTPSGGAWTEDIDSSGSRMVRLNNSTGSAGPDSSCASCRVGAVLAFGTAISGTHFKVSATVEAIQTANDTPMGLRFGGTDSANFCAAMIYPTGQAFGARLVEYVAGVATTIDTDGTAVAVGSVIAVIVNGTAVSVTDDGVEILSATSSVCDNGTAAGVIFGNLAASTDDLGTGQRWDDFTVEDLGASSAGISLQNGTNRITLTATDTAGQTTAVVLTVIKGADTEAPSLTIDTPTSAATYTTSTQGGTLEGSASDNVGVSSVVVSCPSATPASPTVTIAAGRWSAPAPTWASGANACTVTATDAAANAREKTITVTFSAADTTPPVVTITAPTGSPTYTTTNSHEIFQGTATDANGVVSCTYANTGGGSGSVSGPNPWVTPSVPMAVGTNQNVVTITCFDPAGNPGTASITVSRTLALAVTTPQAMPGATVGQAYSFQMSSNCSNTPCTWTNNGAGTTLNDVDGDCGVSAISTTGLVSWTPGSASTCSWTSRVQDALGNNDTETHTIVATVASTGAHGWAESLLARSDFWRGRSFRPDPAVTGSDPGVAANFRYGGFPTQSFDVVYDYAGDTDPHRQDATKLIIEPFTRHGVQNSFTLTSSVSASADSWDCAAPPIAGFSCFKIQVVGDGRTAPQNDIEIKIDDEIMDPADPDGSGTTYRQWILPPPPVNVGELIVKRGHLNTTVASHTVGTPMLKTTNSLHSQHLTKVDLKTAGGSEEYGTADGYTYYFAWDVYYTDSYLTPAFGTQKSFQIECWIAPKGARICFEPRFTFINPRNNTLGGGSTICQGYANGSGTPGVDVAVLNIRTYLDTGTVTDWASSTGKQTRPPDYKGGGDVVCPSLAFPTIRPNRWNRICVRVEQRANDYDYIDAWWADEQNGPTQILNNWGGSMDLTTQTNPLFRGMDSWRAEHNTSEDPGWGRLTNLVSYIRNFVALRTPGLKSAGTLSDAMMPTCERPLP